MTRPHPVDQVGQSGDRQHLSERRRERSLRQSAYLVADVESRIRRWELVTQVVVEPCRGSRSSTPWAQAGPTSGTGRYAGSVVLQYAQYQYFATLEFGPAYQRPFRARWLPMIVTTASQHTGVSILTPIPSFRLTTRRVTRCSAMRIRPVLRYVGVDLQFEQMAEDLCRGGYRVQSCVRRHRVTGPSANLEKAKPTLSNMDCHTAISGWSGV